MKHHFADTLDRCGDYWTITPNRERWSCHYDDLNDAPADASRLTITRGDWNWRRALVLKNLTELTLHEPDQDQLAAIADFSPLRALRISHARPATLAMLEGQTELRELVLEYVSRVSDLSPVGALPCLTALHLENLRGVTDFSGLGGARTLRYLSIYGTLDWNQPVQSLDFLASLSHLEYLRFGWGVRAPATPRPLAPLLRLKKLRKLLIHRMMFPLEDFAWLEVNLPQVEGAVQPVCNRSGGKDRKISADDYRSEAKMPLEKFTRFSGLFIGQDGARYEHVPHRADLLGKGARDAYGTEEQVAAKCRAHEEKYRRLMEKHQREKLQANP